MSGENNHIRNEIDVIADAMADEEDDDYDPYDEVGDNQGDPFVQQPPMNTRSTRRTRRTRHIQEEETHNQEDIQEDETHIQQEETPGNINQEETKQEAEDPSQTTVNFELPEFPLLAGITPTFLLKPDEEPLLSEPFYPWSKFMKGAKTLEDYQTLIQTFTRWGKQSQEKFGMSIPATDPKTSESEDRFKQYCLTYGDELAKKQLKRHYKRNESTLKFERNRCSLYLEKAVKRQNKKSCKNMLVDIKSRMLQLQKKALGDADADAAIDEEFALEKLDKESKYYFITANLPELSTQKPGEIGGEDPSQKEKMTTNILDQDANGPRPWSKRKAYFGLRSKQILEQWLNNRNSQCLGFNVLDSPKPKIPQACFANLIDLKDMDDCDYVLLGREHFKTQFRFRDFFEKKYKEMLSAEKDLQVRKNIENLYKTILLNLQKSDQVAFLTWLFLQYKYFASCLALMLVDKLHPWVRTFGAPKANLSDEPLRSLVVKARKNRLFSNYIYDGDEPYFDDRTHGNRNDYNDFKTFITHPLKETGYLTGSGCAALLDTREHWVHFIAFYELTLWNWYRLGQYLDIPHYHIYLQFTKPKQWSWIKQQLYRHLRKHHTIDVSDKDRIGGAMAYCRKERDWFSLGEAFIPGQFFSTKLYEYIYLLKLKRNINGEYRFPTAFEFFAEFKQQSMMSNIYTDWILEITRKEAAYASRNKTRTTCKLADWGIDLILRIALEERPRQLFWVWADAGEIGKSACSSWFNHMYPSTIVLQSHGKRVFESASYMINGREKLWVFDLPRDEKQGKGQLYALLEESSSTVLVSTKYKCYSKSKSMNNCLVVANSPPEFVSPHGWAGKGTQRLSSDRWFQGVYRLVAEGQQKVLRPCYTERDEAMSDREYYTRYQKWATHPTANVGYIADNERNPEGWLGNRQRDSMDVILQTKWALMINSRTWLPETTGTRLDQVPRFHTQVRTKYQRGVRLGKVAQSNDYLLDVCTRILRWKAEKQLLEEQVKPFVVDELSGMIYLDSNALRLKQNTLSSLSYTFDF